VDYQAGIVHLSSSDGTPPETRESKPSVDDLNHIQSQDVYKQVRRMVITLACYFLPFTEIACDSRSTAGCTPRSLLVFPQPLRPTWNHGRRTSSLSFVCVSPESGTVRKGRRHSWISFECVSLGSGTARKGRRHGGLQIGLIWCAIL